MSKDSKIKELKEEVAGEKTTNLAKTSPHTSLAAMMSADGVSLPDKNDIGAIFPGQTKPRLPQIKVIHQGQMFELPDTTDADGVKKVGTFRAMIVPILTGKHWFMGTQPNAYWEESFSKSGGGTRPDCSSLYGDRPETEDPIHPTCTGPDSKDECPYNKFGSGVDDKGQSTKGKKCKNMFRFHLLLENEVIPYRLTLTPGNLGFLEEWQTGIAGKIAFYENVIEFGLKKAENSTGIEYSRITYKVLGTPYEVYENEQEAESMLARMHGIIGQAGMQERMQTEEITRDEATEIADPF